MYLYSRSKIHISIMPMELIEFISDEVTKLKFKSNCTLILENDIKILKTNDAE